MHESIVGIEQMIEPIDEYADWQAIEEWPRLLSHAGSFAAGLIEWIGRQSLQVDDMGFCRRVGGGEFSIAHSLCGGCVDPPRQPARQLVEGMSLKRTEAWRIELGVNLDHVFGGRWRVVGRGRHRCWCSIFFAAAVRQRVEPHQIAADPKAAIADELPLAIEHRQSRQFNREPRVAAVDRPVHGQSAPGFPRRERARDVACEIKVEFRCQFRPRLPKRRRGLRADEFDEVRSVDDEALLGIDMPDKPKRMPEVSWQDIRRRCRRG